MTSATHAPIKSFIYVAIGAFLMALADFFIKKVAVSGVSMATLFFFGVPSGMAILLILAKVNGGIKHHLEPKHPKTLLIRSLLLASMAVVAFKGFQHNPYSQQVMLQQLAPILTIIFSVVFLKENMSRALYFVVASCVLGAWLIINPSFNSGSIFLLLALAAAVLQASAHTYVAAHRYHATALGFTFYAMTFLALIGGVFWLAIDRNVPNLEELLWIQLTTLFACIGIAMVGHGLQSARPHVAQVGVMLYIQTPAAILLGWVAFGEQPVLNSIIGACLIIGSGILFALRGKSKKQSQ
ncbi:MAG: DMT family transporter [Gammaproteobacteria bacterium]